MRQARFEVTQNMFGRASILVMSLERIFTVSKRVGVWIEASTRSFAVQIDEPPTSDT